MKKIVIFLLCVAIVSGGVFLYVKKTSGTDEPTWTEIEVERSDLTEKALAIGKIDPDHEIVIKSQVSGIVENVHREVGETVKRGEALMVIKPEPTPLEMAGAQRQYELAAMNTAYLKNDLDRKKKLFDENFISGKDHEDAQKLYREAEIREKQAKERLELLENGTSTIGDLVVESVIRSPTDGTILERLVNVGDPVVPLTSYQPGTELMRIASMEDLIFIGTVDEIDVGKIAPGMKANINIGALPDKKLAGELYFISPKSRLKDNVVVFDIKIHVTETDGIKLRAGYSASADIIITEKIDVLNIPERLVEFQGDSTFVNVKAADADSLVLKPVKLGFSDGLSVEIIEGLEDSDTIIEKQVQ